MKNILFRKVKLVALSLCLLAKFGYSSETIGLILVGETGVGKTSLLNALANACAGCEDFSNQLKYICQPPKNSKYSQTMNCSVYNLHDQSSDLVLLDTKGFASTDEDPDDKIAQSIAKSLEDNKISAIALVFNIGVDRFNLQIERIVKKINELFPRGTDLFSRVILVFTHCDNLTFREEQLSEFLASAKLEDRPRFYFSSQGIAYKASFNRKDFFKESNISIEALCGRKFDPYNPEKNEKLARERLRSTYTMQLRRNLLQFREMIARLRNYAPLESNVFQQKRIAYEAIDESVRLFCNANKMLDILDRERRDKEIIISVIMARIDVLSSDNYLDAAAQESIKIDVVNRNYDVCYESSSLAEEGNWCKRGDLPEYRNSAPNFDDENYDPDFSDDISIGKIVKEMIYIVTRLLIDFIRDEIRGVIVCKKCTLPKSGHREVSNVVRVRSPEIDGMHKQQRDTEIQGLYKKIDILNSAKETISKSQSEFKGKKINCIEEISKAIGALSSLQSWDPHYLRRSVQRSCADCEVNGEIDQIYEELLISLKDGSRDEN